MSEQRPERYTLTTQISVGDHLLTPVLHEPLRVVRDGGSYLVLELYGGTTIERTKKSLMGERYRVRRGDG